MGGDSAPKTAIILDCLKKIHALKECSYDMVIDLDITSPLCTLEDIRNLIQTQIRTVADVTTSVTDARRNPYFNMIKK